MPCDSHGLQGDNPHSHSHTYAHAHTHTNQHSKTITVCKLFFTFRVRPVKHTEETCILVHLSVINNSVHILKNNSTH